MQQLRSKPLFEFTDLAADRCLRQPQFACRGGKAAAFDYFDEGKRVVQVGGHASPQIVPLVAQLFPNIANNQANLAAVASDCTERDRLGDTETASARRTVVKRLSTSALIIGATIAMTQVATAA